MTGKIDVSGTMLRGAFAKRCGDKLTDNPYPDAPGYYVLQRAWRHGYANAEAILTEHSALTEIAATVRPRALAVGGVSGVSGS
jgi:hypothetical protein